MIIDKNYDGVRLDRFTSSELNMPHSLVAKLIRKGKIKINGKKGEISLRLKEGDEIILPSSVEITPKQAKKGENFVSEVMLLEFKQSIIFENENFFAINKPSGLATQGGSKVKLCVDDFILKLNPEFRLVHRLDKETSGVLLIAKNRKSATEITSTFASKNIIKKYLAITNGVPKNQEGTIKSFLSKEKEFMVISNEGKESITHYKVLKSNKEFALLEILIETGRMHQIRAHLSSINCKIVGDLKYGDCLSNESKSVLPKMLLHSYSIQYENSTITAPIPNYFDDFLYNFLS
jgi:23S rRNA pseudouridine955/2504/2580 synthase